MLQKWLFLIISLWLAGCAPATSNTTPQTNNPPSPDTSVQEASPLPEPESTAAIDAETIDLANAFVALRKEEGQFNGGTWNEVVDRWLGGKHAAMIELGDRLGNGRYRCAQLTDLLQQPDHTVQGGDPLYDLIQTLPSYQTFQDETAQFLVYEWRGTHDFLFFVCQDGRITASEWWYAGE